MPPTLQHFSGTDLRLDADQTRRLLKYFYPASDVDYINIGDEERSFAQALLIEAIDASAAMSYVETLFRGTANPTAEVKGIIKSLMKVAMTNWFRHLTGKDFEDPKIYESVKSAVAYQAAPAWRIKVAIPSEAITY